jgi:hypothetical protein
MQSEATAHDMSEESPSLLSPSTALERKRPLPLEEAPASPAPCKHPRNEASETQPVDLSTSAQIQSSLLHLPREMRDLILKDAFG